MRSLANVAIEETQRRVVERKRVGIEKEYLTDSRNGGDNLSQLEFVENGSFTGSILQITTHKKSASRIPATALASFFKTLHNLANKLRALGSRPSGAATKCTGLLTTATKQGKDKTYQANHQDTHLLLAEEAGEQFRY